MFGKKKTTTEAVPELSSEMGEKIHIMPERFIVSGGKKRNNTFIILLIIIILLLVIFSGLVLLYFLQKPKLLPQDNVNADALGNVNMNTNIDTNVNANSNANFNINTNVNIEPTPTPAPTPELLTDMSDIDSDGLSVEEERLFSTNANNPDTDSDGYGDAQEILAGYDPRLAQKTLEESDIAAMYIFHGFNFLYPAKWVASEPSSDLANFDTLNSDSVQVSFFENASANKTDAVGWIKNNDPALLEGDIEKMAKKGFEAYKTRNGLRYYIFSENFNNVFIFSYNPASANAIIYPIAFQMMAESLKL